MTPVRIVRSFAVCVTCAITLAAAASVIGHAADHRDLADGTQSPAAAQSPAATPASNAGMCSNAHAPFVEQPNAPAWRGWGADVANTRYQPSPGLTAEETPKLKLKWAFGFPGATQAYSQPTIAGGRVFVGSQGGKVYSLDLATGCTYWTYDTGGAGVRTGVTVGRIGQGGSARTAVFFGDIRAFAHAVDASTGQMIWKQKLDDHSAARITGSTTFHEGRLYVPMSSVEEGPGASAQYACCTFRGSVSALDAAAGTVIWKSYTIAEAPKEYAKNAQGQPLSRPAGAAIWSSPTIDAQRGLLYVGTGNGYTEPAAPTSDSVLAMDLKTGKIVWANQVTPNDAFVTNCRPGVENLNCPKELGPDHDFGNSPILRSLGGGKRIIVIGQKSGVAYGLDPDQQGKVLWQFRAGKGSALGGIEWGSAADEQAMYVPVSDVLLPASEAGGLFALRLATGEKIWHTPAPNVECTGNRGCTGAQSAPVSVIPGVVFSGSIDGHLRAFSTKDGAIIWDFNTAVPFETVNGVTAKGGSLDGAGPAIADGVLVTNSGYAPWRGIAGNVLLAFSAK